MYVVPQVTTLTSTPLVSTPLMWARCSEDQRMHSCPTGELFRQGYHSSVSHADSVGSV